MNIRTLIARCGVVASIFMVMVELAVADFTFYSGRTEYILVTTARTWDAAEADAVSKGGHLVQINDAAENALVLSKISGKVTTTASDGGAAAYCWIGGKETTTEGTYAWVGGATFWAGGKTGSVQNGLYQNWGRLTSPYGGPEPDNYGGTQDRAAMALGSWPVFAAAGAQIGDAGQWNDIGKTNLLYYVIERPIAKPSEGLFAVFQMTQGGVPAGSFTCQLHYDRAPKTVASFVSLVEGTRAWLDFSKGKVRKAPYYQGLTMHRIISNFMIQGGCPFGNGTGGPGYRFPDEFVSSLRHDHPGVLSMANSGVNTNGSQFFVTVAAVSSLDDKHTIFGEVVEGYESCVLPLSKVATDASDKPLQEVKIASITIQRVGAAAQAFNPLAVNLGLPVCEVLPVKFERSAVGQMGMSWNEIGHSDYKILDSADLSAWTWQSPNYYSGFAPVANQSVDVTAVPAAGAPKHFFQVVRTVYQPLVVASPLGKRMNMTCKDGTLVTMTFTSATGGSHRVKTTGTYDLTSVLSNVVWGVNHHDTIVFSSDINPPINAGNNVFLTHSDWVFTFVNGTQGSFQGGFYTADRSKLLQESGSFVMDAAP